MYFTYLTSKLNKSIVLLYVSAPRALTTCILQSWNNHLLHWALGDCSILACCCTTSVILCPYPSLLEHTCIVNFILELGPDAQNQVLFKCIATGRTTFYVFMFMGAQERKSLLLRSVRLPLVITALYQSYHKGNWALESTESKLNPKRNGRRNTVPVFLVFSSTQLDWGSYRTKCEPRSIPKRCMVTLFLRVLVKDNRQSLRTQSSFLFVCED